MMKVQNQMIRLLDVLIQDIQCCVLHNTHSDSALAGAESSLVDVLVRPLPVILLGRNVDMFTSTFIYFNYQKIYIHVLWIKVSKKYFI